jgi:hypothetical protein
MKVLITEFQYNNLLNNNKKTILITESQYERLLLNEQNDFVFDMHHQPEVYRYQQKQTQKQMASLNKSLSNAWKAAQKIHIPTEVEKLFGVLDKNIGKPWSKWADDRIKYDLPYIYRDIKRSFGENPFDGFKEMGKYLSEPNNWQQVERGFELMGETLTTPQSYYDVALGFQELWSYLKNTGTDFYEWLKTWTWEDWLDLAAIILYCIPTPVTWGIATAIEGGLIINAVAKDNMSEAGWRTLGIVGGGLLSKLLGGSYKASWKTLDETTRITTKATQIGAENGEAAMKIYLRKELKNASSETESYIRKLMNFKKTDFAKMKVIHKDMEKITAEYQKLKKMHPSWSDRKLVKKSTQNILPKNVYAEIFEHIAPISSFERKLFVSIFSGAKALQFTGYLRQLGVPEKEIQQLLNHYATLLADKPLEERNKQADLSEYNLSHAVMVEHNKAAVKLGLKIEKNCTPSNPGKLKVKNISDQSFANLNENGIDVDAGGNYQYKVVMNNDVPNDESGVYIRKESFSEGEENEWQTANCSASLKVMKKWCKATNPQRRNSSDYFSACIEMFSVGMTTTENAAIWLHSDEKINKVSDYVRQSQNVKSILDEFGAYDDIDLNFD